MCASRCPAALRYLTALAIGAVALTLTGCGSGDSDGGGDTDPASAATSEASATSSPSADEPAPPPTSNASASSSADPWSGTKQFVQIKDAWTSDGQTYLSVRPARKEAVTEPHEYWVIIPGEGPYTTVPLAEDARVLLSVPIGDDKQAAPYSEAEFVSRLTAQSPSDRTLVGYDLSFDGEGQVTRLQSLLATT